MTKFNFGLTGGPCLDHVLRWVDTYDVVLTEASELFKLLLHHQVGLAYTCPKSTAHCKHTQVRGLTKAGPSKVFEVGVYSLENRRLPKVVVASRLCRDDGKMGVNCL